MRPISLWGHRAGRRLVPHALRRRMRHPSWSWALAGVLGLVTVLGVHGSLDAAADGARRYGSPAPAVVATRDLAAGTVVGPDDVERRKIPAAALPDHRPTVVPLGRTLRAPVAVGQPLADAQLADEGTSPLAAVVPTGRTALAVPRGDHPLGLASGDAVDLWGLDPTAGTVAAAAAEALVVTVGEASMVVAVRPDEVPAVMGALAAGTVWPTLPG